MDVVPRQEIEIPWNAQIFSVQVRHERVCAWALVNPGNARLKLGIRCFATGEPIEESLLSGWIGTVQTGNFVWHFFADGRP